MTTELYTIHEAPSQGEERDRLLLLIYYTSLPEPRTDLVFIAKNFTREAALTSLQPFIDVVMDV